MPFDNYLRAQALFAVARQIGSCTIVKEFHDFVMTDDQRGQSYQHRSDLVANTARRGNRLCADYPLLFVRNIDQFL